MKLEQWQIGAILVVAILIIISLFYFNKNKEGFTDYIGDKYEKTIYLIWNNKLKDSKTIHGFGDKIRGALFLYQYCKLHKVNLKINAQDDVCGDYLQNVVQPLSKKSDEFLIINNTKLYNTTSRKLTKQLNKKKDVYLYTNDFPIKELDKDDKKFAKYLCKPKKELKNKIDKKIKILPKDYGIQHFRFNDDVLKNDINYDNPLFKKAYNILKENFKKTDVLMSNSTNFKKYAIQHLNIKTIDDAKTQIKHIGENNDSGVEYSFIEFFICCKAKYINTHTAYFWPSNFVYWSSKIYNIPFTNTFLYKNPHTLTID
jgi:hypothetical protein